MARTASRTTPNLGSQPLRGADFERAHSSVVLGEGVRDQRRGFTIVELLIVVVVIAILAAITIVAYNGITDRAKATAAASAAEQAAKKVMTYAAVNSDQYPASLTDAGVADGSAMYQYRVDNTSSPKTFCITTTTQSVSFFVSNMAATPTAGACAGHSPNGQPLATNLQKATIPPSSGGASGTPWFVNGSMPNTTTSGVATVESAAWATTGYAARLTGLATSTVANGQLDFSAAVGALPATEGEYMAGRVAVKASKALDFRVRVRFRTAASGGTITGDVYGATTSVPAGTPTTVPFVVLAPAGTTVANVTLMLTGTANLADGSYFEAADPIFVTGNTVPAAFRDGNSAGWAWNGTANQSTSTGPAP